MVSARPTRPGPSYGWRRPPRRFVVAVGILLALFIAGLASFGPIVRRRIAKEADRRKLDVEIGGVRPGFFGVSLRDVRVRPRGVSGLEARLEHVRVDVGVTFSVQGVSASGGGVFVEGELDDVADRLRELRKASGATAVDGGGEPRKGRTSIAAENISFSWKLPSGGEVTGSGLRVSRDADGIKLGCAKCAARRRDEGGKRQLALEVTGADVELALDGAPRRVNASTLSVAVDDSGQDPPKPLATSPAAATGSADPSPPPLPVVHRRGAKPAPIALPAPSNEPMLPLPDPHVLRSRIATAVTSIAARLPDGGNVEIGGLSIKLELGGEPVAFGPGAFSLTRRADRVHLAFASSPEDAGAQTGTPLSIDADLPVSTGEMTARLAGGPVSLAALGVKEGTKGLTDVARGTISGKGQLVLSAAADALTFDGEVALRSISLKEPRIAPEPLRRVDFSVSARGVLAESGKLRVDDAQLDMGALHVKTHGTVEDTADHFAVSLALDVAPASCQALLDSAPQGLLPIVRTARMAGTFSAIMNLAFDTRTIEKLVLDYKIDDQCRIVEVPRDLSRERFTGEFTYRTYHPDGTIGETTTGPGTPEWTNLDDISPFMVAAVLTTEDGAFYKHNGFNHAAIRSSVQANLKARRFVRGASTITMQLAKNLFLARDKALSRKIEEVVLTDYLEQIFRKDEMMELYLNVVEFGPDVYGITQAAEHYFGRKPEELNLPECFFLASLLPSPIRYGRLREKGEVSETWMRHLTALMQIAARNGKISHSDLEEGLKGTVVFVRPGDPRPEPRKPVTSRRRDTDDDDAAWRPLD